MTSTVRTVAATFAAALALLAAQAWAEIDDKVAQALAADVRTDAERDRDANRMPLNTLKFFGLTDDMHVLELVPGGGWYTKILAPVLAENGKLALSLGADRAGAMSEENGWDVEVVETGSFAPVDGTRRYQMTDVDFGSERFDMVLTFRNLHNFVEEGRRNVNEAAFRALKPGGRYGVVDHTRRHMQANTDENWRRVDPVRMIKEIEAVGFDFVDYSKLHYRADDELRYEVGRKSVTGNTDRFTLLFMRPE